MVNSVEITTPVTINDNNCYYQLTYPLDIRKLVQNNKPIETLYDDAIVHGNGTQ